MIEAKVIEDSTYEGGKRLTTMQLKYPRVIHAEAKTHRVIEIGGQLIDLMEDVAFMDDPSLSRNASSTRAIPTAKLANSEFFEPTRYGKNKAGMQAAEENLEGEALERAKAIWRHMADVCAAGSKELAELGLHKQWAGRPTEWFTHINVVVTATEWDNFFALRDHPDAQPEIRELARAMKAAMAASTPRVLGFGEWHLPYLDDAERLGLPLKDQVACSVARCARVSYLRHDLTAPNLEDDRQLHDRLVLAVPPHMSPTEHQATPTLDTSKQANLRGWMQYRRQTEMGDME